MPSFFHLLAKNVGSSTSSVDSVLKSGNRPPAEPFRILSAPEPKAG
ncbi:hypothetical protein [uncultured Ruminococcus sp.]|nr:hypothetical protein [uncultured Ruminococcus sp.]